METSSARQGLATPEQVSEHLGVPESTLRQWRYLDKGPRYSKVGRHVRYRWSDVDTWVDVNTETPGGGR